MTERLADPLLQTEIDEWILDYLVFSAIKALLEAYKASKGGLGDMSEKHESASICLQLVDSFFTTFCMMHPDYEAEPDLHFRLRLLKFTVMFTKRSAPDEAILPGPLLQNLRHQRQEQANCFRLGNNEFPAFTFPDFSEHLLSLHHKNNRRGLIAHGSTAGNRSSTTHDLFQPAISLLDTVPFFMALSAAQISMQEGTITDTWMRLAAGYMAQAVAEQYLVYDAQREGTFQEAFSWGFDPECSAEEGTDDFQINAMFWGMDAVVDGWDKIRDEHVQAVRSDLRGHLEMLTANDLSVTEFEQRLIDFLDNLLMGQSKPVLMQVELGRVEGLRYIDIDRLSDTIGMT